MQASDLEKSCLTPHFPNGFKNNKHDQTCSCYGVVESTTPCRFYHPYWHQTAIHIAICELVWRVCCDFEEFMLFQCLPRKNGSFLWYIYIYIRLLLYKFCTCHILATSPNSYTVEVVSFFPDGHGLWRKVLCSIQVLKPVVLDLDPMIPIKLMA